MWGGGGLGVEGETGREGERDIAILAQHKSPVLEQSCAENVLNQQTPDKSFPRLISASRVPKRIDPKHMRNPSDLSTNSAKAYSNRIKIWEVWSPLYDPIVR